MNRSNYKEEDNELLFGEDNINNEDDEIDKYFKEALAFSTVRIFYTYTIINSSRKFTNIYIDTTSRLLEIKCRNISDIIGNSSGISSNSSYFSAFRAYFFGSG